MVVYFYIFLFYIFSSVTVFFNSRVCFLFKWLLFPCQTSCFVYASLSLFCLVVFSYSSLNFLKRIILHSLTVRRSPFLYSQSLQFHSFARVMFSYFLWFLMYSVGICTSGWWGSFSRLYRILWQRQFFTSQVSVGFWVCLLVVSFG